MGDIGAKIGGIRVLPLRTQGMRGFDDEGFNLEIHRLPAAVRGQRGADVDRAAGPPPPEGSLLAGDER
jgi:hypothetical protein